MKLGGNLGVRFTTLRLRLLEKLDVDGWLDKGRNSCEVELLPRCYVYGNAGVQGVLSRMLKSG